MLHWTVCINCQNSMQATASPVFFLSSSSTFPFSKFACFFQGDKEIKKNLNFTYAWLTFHFIVCIVCNSKLSFSFMEICQFGFEFNNIEICKEKIESFDSFQGRIFYELHLEKIMVYKIYIKKESKGKLMLVLLTICMPI